MDTLTAAQRSRVMAAIHGRDTKPEMVVRRYLFARGFRFRVNYARLPGHPDIVLRKYRTVVFVNGCFWHGHDCGAYRPPKTNEEFWTRKITRNQERDREEQRALARMGWHCVTVWECELKPAVKMRTLQALEYTLNRIYLENHRVRYAVPEEEALRAAEPTEDEGVPYGKGKR